ncbi:MAG: 4Fe-4S dicluster domain-containing protein [Chloroflexi bacterium]|nr:4Fe-4S dicluster domain-containing protein [Chloroflexota bacterium]
MSKKSNIFQDAISSFVQGPVTENYPAEKRPIADRFRGELSWSPEGCSGCNLCAKECPAGAIEVITLDRKAKRFVVRFRVDRCAFCGQCQTSCRKGCIDLANDRWELASYDRSDFEKLYGHPDDIAEYLASLNQSEATDD